MKTWFPASTRKTEAEVFNQGAALKGQNEDICGAQEVHYQPSSHPKVK